MNVYDVVKAVNGEIVRGRARVHKKFLVGPQAELIPSVKPGQHYLQIGFLNGSVMTFTDEGRALADALTGALDVVDFDELPAKPVARRKARTKKPVEPASVEGDLLDGLDLGDVAALE